MSMHLSDALGTCVVCSGPVAAHDLHAAKSLCNICSEWIAHNWFQFVSTCSLCKVHLSEAVIEERDVVLCDGCGGESIAADEEADEVLVH